MFYFYCLYCTVHDSILFFETDNDYHLHITRANYVLRDGNDKYGERERSRSREWEGSI